MTARTRLLLRWCVISGLFLAGGVAAAMLLAGRPGEESEGPLRGLTDIHSRRIPEDAPAISFAEIAGEAGIAFRHFPGKRGHLLPEDMGSGTCLADLDGDDDLDLVLVGSGRIGRGGRTALYENLGGGKFRDRTEDSGVIRDTLGMGVAAGDYDGDGDLDLYLTAYGANALYRNEGGFRFEDVTGPAGVEGHGFSTGAVFADLDGDGDLDLYVCRYVRFLEGEEGGAAHQADRSGYALPFTLNPSSYDPVPNLLFENRGDGTFTERAAEAGAANPGGRSLGAVAADLDGDGHQDLYVANDVSDNVLLTGAGGLRFIDVSHETATADYRGAMGLAVGDATGDGELDLYVTHWLAQENAYYKNLRIEVGRLFFTDQATPRGLGAPALDVVGWGTTFLDFDLDGRRDVVVVNGSTFEEPEDRTLLIPEPIHLFWNGGGKRGFFNLATRAGPALSRRYVARGLSVGDIDRDGDPDLVVNVLGGRPLLLRNDQATGHGFLRVRVRGAGGNRFGVGTMVEVRAGDRVSAGVIGAQVSYLSSAEPELLFGTGASTSVEVSVTFPDGAVRVYPGVEPGRTLFAERP